MADEPNTYDTGEPRFGNPIWRGRYSLSPSEGVTFDSTTVMLTKDNTVQFCGEATNVTADSVFATLPHECWPNGMVVIPTVYNDGTYKIGYITISPVGELKTNGSGTIMTNGLVFNICGNYYH